jgi:hypothetical protein
MAARNQLVTNHPANQTHSEWPRRLFTIVLSAWTALFFVRLLAELIYSSPGHDQNWMICAAQRTLSGAKLYGPQISEVNTPLIMWFSMIPALLSRLLHLAPDQVLKLLVLAMICGSAAWSVRILRNAGWATSPASVYLLLCALLTGETWLSGYNFGQREHLVIILILPYILSAASGAASKMAFPERCALGFIGGIALCFKPQQVLILVGLEIFLAAWNRSLRRLVGPDFLCALAAVFAYIGSVSLFAPLYFKIMPILLDTYSSFASTTTWALIKDNQAFLILFLQILIIFILQRRRLRFAALPGAMLACSIASAVAYYVQHAGWYYQEIPQIAFLILAALFILLDFPPVLTNLIDGWRFTPAFILATSAMLCLAVPLQFHFERAAERRASGNPIYPSAVFAQYPPRSPVYVFSTNVSDAFPAVSHDHLVWASRFPALWMLPAIIENQSAEAGGPPPAKRLPPQVVEQLANLQRAETTEDFRRWKPVVVVVKKCPAGIYCHGLDRYNFDPLPWFLESPAFAAEWSHYRLQQVHGIYSVYVRTH